jgi:Ethanolamine utilization protein EutJ (predicted chaperonin)
MRTLAVDFGTSNTVAALAFDDGAPRLVTIDGSPLVPSSVFLTDDGALAVGRDADRQARIDPSRYEPNPKRRIDDGDILLGAAAIPVSRVIAAVLGRVAGEVRRQLGSQADEVRLTHPARWGQLRKKTLIAAAHEAGLVPEGTEPLLIPEPVAAATHFATQSGAGLPDGGELAVYDLGGGTFDVAIVQRRSDLGAQQGLARSGSYQVLAEAGLPDLGGLDFDHAIIEHIGDTHARDEDPEMWAKLLAPTDAASRRLQRALVTDVRDGKEALSRYPHTDIALPPPFGDVHLTRSEFEELIRPNLGRSVDLLRQTIANAGIEVSGLAGIYLVGGSSRVPLVARLIQEGLGVTPTTLDQPETSVATGALYLPVGRPQQGNGQAPASGQVRAQAPPAFTGQVPTGVQSGPVPAHRTGYPSVGVPAAGYQNVRPNPVQGPQITLGPPALAHELPGRPASGPPTKSTRNRVLLIAAAAVIVVALAVGLPLLLTRHHGKDNAGPPNPSASTSTSSSPLPDGTCGSDFGKCIGDASLRSYISPTYSMIKSCQSNTALGSSLPAGTGITVVTCTYDNGTQVAFGKTGSASDLETYRAVFGQGLSSLSGLKVGTSGTWKNGTKIPFNGDPNGSGLYWDNNNTFIFAMAASETQNLTLMQQWWSKNFDR